MSVLVDREIIYLSARERGQESTWVRLDPWARLHIPIALLCETLAESGDALMDLGYSWCVRYHKVS